MKSKANFTYIDYGKIRRLSCCIDCTVVESDFDTSRPNPYRINATANDINRFLKYGGNRTERKDEGGGFCEQNRL